MSDRLALVLGDLTGADKGSFYTIAGAGGDLEEWIDGYEGLLEKGSIGRPAKWYQTTGSKVNAYAQQRHGGEIAYNDQFPADLTILMFPLDGLDVGKLAIFKLMMQDRWFDDCISNMRVVERQHG